MADRLHTNFPRVDSRFPHYAPALGAQPLIHQPERGLESALGDMEPTTPAANTVRADPWPEVTVGVATALASGAVTGGVAAGSWLGASIGGGLSAALWSGWTLFGSWRELGPNARSVLGGAVTLGLGTMAVGVWMRKRGGRR